MIERDDNIPPFEDLLAELAQAERIATQTLPPADRDDRPGYPIHAELA
jgi:uncharacterized protein (UPF0276 family)